jgi:hypothetical protein
MVFLRRSQPLPDDVKVSRWRLDSPLGFLLEGMEGIDGPGELPSSAESLQYLGVNVLSAQLGLKVSEADRLADPGGECLQVLVG